MIMKSQGQRIAILTYHTFVAKTPLIYILIFNITFYQNDFCSLTVEFTYVFSYELLSLSDINY